MLSFLKGNFACYAISLKEKIPASFYSSGFHKREILRLCPRPADSGSWA